MSSVKPVSRLVRYLGRVAGDSCYARCEAYPSERVFQDCEVETGWLALRVDGEGLPEAVQRCGEIACLSS
jgi:hypothetical protein